MKFLMTLIVFLAFPALALAAPSIEFIQTRADLGFVSSSETVEFTFEFTNAGDEELIIHNITTS